MDSVLVTTYVNPDLDGYACAYAYAELLTKTHVDAKAGISGSPHPEARWVIEAFAIQPLLEVNPEQYQNIILVDTCDTTHLDKRIIPNQVVEIIDHRIVQHTNKFRNAKVQIEYIGACATLIAERFQKQHVTPSKEAAILLHGAIISNTINFQSPLTTQRDLDAKAWLHEFSRLPDEFARELFLAKSDLHGEKLAEHMIGDVGTQEFAGKHIAIAQVEIVGAETLLKERFHDIMDILNQIKISEQSAYTALNIIDVERGYNVIITDDSIELFTHALGLQFHKHIARTTGLLMRKQIWPKLKASLEITK